MGVNINRRSFIGGAAASLFAGCATTKSGSFEPPKLGNIKSVLLHLGTNMWSDRSKNFELSAFIRKFDPTIIEEDMRYVDYLRFDEQCWIDQTNLMAKLKLNQLIVDVGEGIVLSSHPEIAVKGSWTPDKMRSEIRRLNAMGIEVIPKLNFSTCHDAWMGVYSRMVSTKKYYQFCSDVIADVAEIFGYPRFFHIGMDEELAGAQKDYDYCVIRGGDLWWHDFKFYVAEVEKHGMRAITWCDRMCYHDDFCDNCPKSVIPCKGYYRQWFDFNDPAFPEDYKKILRCYETLEKAGFDQLPCGTNWACDENQRLLIKYCREKISPKHLLGFLSAPWQHSTWRRYDKCMACINLFADALEGK